MVSSSIPWIFVLAGSRSTFSHAARRALSACPSRTMSREWSGSIGPRRRRSSRSSRCFRRS
jgi:hypothetical protein